MALIDETHAEAIYAAMGPAIEISGGSAANTIVGVAAFGGQRRLHRHREGRHAGRRLHARHSRRRRELLNLPPFENGPATARCYILVTPDGERTMNTYLGAAQLLSAAEVTEAEVAAAKVTYLEGYLWDPQNAKDAFLKAAKIAHQAKRTVALTLSDAFCVDRYRNEFRALVVNGTVDLLFANESELKSLYQTADFDTAVAALREQAKLAVVTRSEKGALVVTREKIEAVDAFPVEEVVDTTGAGDLFAAGFLYGFARGLPHATSARLGALAAAEVISHLGARPERGLAELAREKKLLR